MRVTGVRSEVSAKWESRYREVLDAAAIAFAENGYLGASTRDIAERLGIRAASLYYYLPSKEAALLAICKLGVLDFIDNLKDIIARRDPAPEKLRAAITKPSAAAQPSCRRLHSRFRLAPARVAEWATPGNRTAGTDVSETDPTDLCGRHCGWRICQRPQSRARNARPPWSVQFSDRGPILAADFDHR